MTAVLRSSKLAVLCFILVAGFFCSTVTVMAAEEKTEILIGAPVPLTGGLAQNGEEEKWAYEQCMKDVNAQGGIFVKEFNKKLPLKLAVADAESDPGQAAAAAERLVKVNKVDLMLSSFGAEMVMPTCVVADKEKIYYHTTTCHTPIYRSGHFKYSTLYFFELAQASEVPFELLKSIPEAERPKNLAIVAEDSQDGRGWTAGIVEAIKKFPGFSIAAIEAVGVDSKDYNAQILKLKSKGIDGVLMLAGGGDCVTFVRQCKENKFNYKFLMGYKGTFHTDFWDALGKDANYVLGDAFWFDTWPYPKAKEIGDRYEKAFKRRSVTVGAYYALAQTLFKAIEIAGTLDSLKVRDAVLNTHFKDTVMGDIKYNPADGVASWTNATAQWWNGELKPVYPFNLTGGYKLKLAPPWDKR
jgi:branched-chain amino acid transport system substrate-binding protein